MAAAAGYSLQQTELTSFASTDHEAVAFLRRSCTVLSFNSTEHLVSVHRQDEKGKWKRCGTWNVPTTDRVIGFFALESFYYFLVLTGQSFASSSSCLILCRAGWSYCGIFSRSERQSTQYCLVGPFVWRKAC